MNTLSLAVLLLCFVIACRASPQDALKNVSTCSVPDDVIQCYPKQDDSARTRVVQGSVCVLPERKESIVCSSNGSWTHENLTPTEGGHLLPSRVRRQLPLLLPLPPLIIPEFLPGLLLPELLPGLAFAGPLALLAAPVLIPVAVKVFTSIIDLFRPREPPDFPPVITCRPLVQKTAPDGSLFALVNLPEPKAYDDRSIPRVECFPPGPVFMYPEGTHARPCVATDNRGQRGTCATMIVVKAKRCSRPVWPSHGSLFCSLGSLETSVCRLFCPHGFQSAAPESAMTCKDKQWSPLQLDCVPVTCPSPPSVRRGSYIAAGTLEYGTSLGLSCDAGFRRRGPSSIFCEASGQWSPHGECVDNESPRFTQGCPADMDVYAGSSGRSEVVSWPLPDAQDNTHDVTVTCDPPSGRTFLPGPHRVVCLAKDAQGNSAYCSFNVIVRTPTCNAPKLDSSGLLRYTCPLGYMMGATCSVSCRSGYPLEGDNQIICKLSKGYPPQPQWTFDTEKPHCRVRGCNQSQLIAPANGALTCLPWSHGLRCSMMCNTDYDIPLNALTTNDFVCGTSDGLWRPPQTPDCNEVRQAESMHLQSQLYYYLGSCPSAEVQGQIRAQFLERLQQSQLGSQCRAVPDCRPDRVTVECGPSTLPGRRRRRRSSGSEILVDFSIAVALPKGGDLASAQTQMSAVLSDVSAALQNEVTSGRFNLDVGGLQLKAEDFASDPPELACPRGTLLNPRSSTCAGCSKGSFFNESTRHCEDCAIGFYGDDDFASVCKECPAHTSTDGTGKKSRQDCLPLCSPGSASVTGFQPCQPCPLGSYSGGWGLTSCLACPPNTTTLQTASTSPSQCVAVDACEGGPCGSHTCLPSSRSYTCQCHDGWSGRNCSVAPDHCQHHQCQNGASCHSNLHNYTCSCPPGFQGNLCERKLRDGGWSAWSNWTQCSVSCDGGSRQRSRECDDPPPGPGGQPCTGPQAQTEVCNAHACSAKCPRLLRPYGVEWNCSTSEDGLISCTAACRGDLVFAKSPLSVYQCGPATDHVWNYVTDEAPNGFVPECTRAHAFSSVEMNVEASFGLPCTAAQTQASAIQAQVTASTAGLLCVQQGTCSTVVGPPRCTQNGRRKRGVTSGGTNMTITVTSSTSGSSLNVTAVLNNQSDPTALLDYVKTVMTLAQSIQQLHNNSGGLLTLQLGGQAYPTIASGLSGHVTCPPGTVPASHSCGECPRGTRQQGETCVLCGQGSYQDSTASTSCKPCPPGYSTPGLGASASTDCTGSSQDATESHPTLTLVLAIVIPSVLLAVAIPLSVWLYKRQKGKRMVSNSSPDLMFAGHPGQPDSCPPPAYHLPVHKV